MLSDHLQVVFLGFFRRNLGIFHEFLYGSISFFGIFLRNLAESQAAFYMIGGMSDVKEKAAKLAAVAAGKWAKWGKWARSGGHKLGLSNKNRRKMESLWKKNTKKMEDCEDLV